MPRRPSLRFLALLAPAAAALALPMAAQAQGWGGYGGGFGGPWGGAWSGPGGGYDGARRASPEPSSKIDVTSYRSADAMALLGKGKIVIAGVDAPAEDLEQGADEPTPDKLPVYEAAVVDALVGHGYDTQTATDAGQIAQVAVSHQVVVPEEQKRSPVSGAMSTTVSNRGSAVSLGVALDFTKPAKAIVSTRMDVRIRDKASGRVLWEGHAEGMAREGEGGLDDGKMAARLAKALFARFPEGQVVVADAGAPGNVPAGMVPIPPAGAPTP
jgi:hypothetical protein